METFEKHQPAVFLSDAAFLDRVYRVPKREAVDLGIVHSVFRLDSAVYYGGLPGAYSGSSLRRYPVSVYRDRDILPLQTALSVFYADPVCGYFLYGNHNGDLLSGSGGGGLDENFNWPQGKRYEKDC